MPVKKECTIPGKAAYVLWRSEFLIDEKYQPIKAIGKGAYGVVCSAKNLVTGEKTAIKKIGNAFENLTDARRTLREIKLLRHLKHDNIIAVKDVLKPPNRWVWWPWIQSSDRGSDADKCSTGTSTMTSTSSTSSWTRTCIR